MITAIQAKANKHLDLSFTPKEIERYSVANAILGMVDGKDGFEKEVSDTLAAQIGRGPRGLRGIFVPTAVRPQASGLDTKLGSTGGFTTTQGVMDLVDVFRSQLRLTALGAQFLPGLKFNALFPTEDSGTTAFWVSENGLLDVTQTDPVFRASLATPHTLSVTTSVSKQLLVQASTSVALESKLRQDIGRAHATALEAAAINGSGAQGEPVGLLKNSGINVVSIGTNGGAATYDTILALEETVASANAPDSVGWLGTPKVRKQLRKVFVNGTGSAAIWQGSNIFEKPAQVSTAVPSTLIKGSGTNLHALIHGAFSEMLLCEFSALELLFDDRTKKKQGIVELTSISFVDVVIPRPSAFAAAVDVVVS
jgi:HK97 family phage major capsid protein